MFELHFCETGLLHKFLISWIFYSSNAIVRIIHETCFFHFSLSQIGANYTKVRIVHVYMRYIM